MIGGGRAEDLIPRPFPKVSAGEPRRSKGFVGDGAVAERGDPTGWDRERPARWDGELRAQQWERPARSSTENAGVLERVSETHPPQGGALPLTPITHLWAPPSPAAERPPCTAPSAASPGLCRLVRRRGQPEAPAGIRVSALSGSHWLGHHRPCAAPQGWTHRLGGERRVHGEKVAPPIRA